MTLEQQVAELRLDIELLKQSEKSNDELFDKIYTRVEELLRKLNTLNSIEKDIETLTELIEKVKTQYHL